MFYDKFHMSCYKYGKQKQSDNACEKATTAMEELLHEEAETVKEEGIASFLATVCDGACRSAVSSEAAPDYSEFQSEFCK